MAKSSERMPGRWSVGAMLTGLVLAVGLIALGDLAVSGPRASASTIGPARGGPDELSELARASLHTRMQSHAADMQQLTLSTLLLRYDDVERVATKIAEEPELSRPARGNGTEVNAEVPEKFFAIQDTLGAATRKLAAAARQRNDEAMAESFGEVTATCMSCHASFLPKER